MKTAKANGLSQQRGRNTLTVKRFFRAFALVTCIVASSTRSASHELVPLNTYRSDFATVSVGRHHLCLKTKGQEVYCFFPNLKKGKHRNLRNIVPLEPLNKQVKSVFYEDYNICTTDMVDALKCGGLNDRRQLGRNVRYNSLSYIFSPEAVTDAAGARDHLCAVVEGAARCWAGNSYAQSTGQVGSPAGDIYPEDSKPVALPEKIDQITASDGSTCARGLSGSVYCWGNNRHGELGTATDIGRDSPHSVVKVPLPRPATKLFDRRTATSCAALNDSSVYCWGGIRTPGGAYAAGPVRLATSTAIADMSGKIALTSAGRLVYVEAGPYTPATRSISATLTPLDARGRVVSISGHPDGINCWVTTPGAAYCLNTDKQTVQIAQD